MNVKFTKEDQLKINGKVYDVECFATDEDGDRLTIVNGWGENIAYWDAELQQMFRRGEAEVV